MQKSNKSKSAMLDDAAGLVGSVAGLLSDVKQQFREDMKSRAKDFADQNNFVHKNELETLNAKLDDLLQRVEKLEKSAKTKK